MPPALGIGPRWASLRTRRPACSTACPWPCQPSRRSDKLTRKAASVGFDWPDAAQVVAKVREELSEVTEASAQGSRAAIEDEVGDLLFAVANLARHFDINPESALRRANCKFERRFRAVETMLAERGTSPAESTLDDMERLWVEAKNSERANVND